MKASGTAFAAARTSLRADAATSARAVGTLPAGAISTRLATKGTWTQVRYQYTASKRLTGWVPTSSLRTKRPTSASSGARWTQSRLGVTSDTDGRKASFTIQASDRVTLLSRTGEWTRIRHGKRTGYVPSNRLYSSIKVAATPGQARFAVRNIPLRKDPRTSPYAGVAARVPGGSKVQVLGTSGAWSRVKYGKVTGYVKTSNDLTTTNYNSVVVYGTFRKGQKNHSMMSGATQRLLSLVLPHFRLMQYGSTNLTFALPSSKSIKVEQYVFSAAKAKKLLPRLDALEATARYKGKMMYKRQLVTLKDGTRSWSYVTTQAATAVISARGREVPQGDFAKRKRW